MVIKKNKTSFKQLELESESSSKKKKKESDPKIGRIWVAVGLLITVGLSGVFWLVSTALSTGFQGLKIKRPAVSLQSMNFEPKVEKTSIGLSPNSKDDLLRLIESNLSDKKGRWSVKVTDLENGYSVSKEEERVMPAASLIKLPVVALAYKQVENGQLSLEDKFEIKDKDIRGGAGSLQYRRGDKASLGELLFLSLNQSDNTAFTILRRILTDEKIQTEIERLGMESTVLVDYLTSARDIDLFFRKLYQGEIVKTYKDDFINGLTNTLFETRIPAGVPEGVEVAHKVGSEAGVSSDAGIVFVPQRPFVLTILSDGSDATADQTIAKLTEEIYWFFVSD